MNQLYIIITLVIMLAGLAGTVLPVLPGIPIIYLGYVLYGFLSAWQHYGAATMILWGLVTLATLFIEYYGQFLGVKRSGSSIFGIWGSFIGAILGIILFNLPGLIAGTFLGAIIGELIAGRPAGAALKSGKGALLGFIAGSLFKAVVGLIMVGAFLWQVLLTGSG